MLRADFLADCGNSCSKISSNSATLKPAYVADAELDTWLAGQAVSSLLLLAGNKQRGHVLETAAAQAGWKVAFFEQDMPVIDCHQYGGMGIDRLCAGIAAINQYQQDVIVVDAGTMLTFGVWCYDTAAEFNCRFGGGFIAPGLQTSLQSMHQAAPALPLLEFAVDKEIGRDTESHMQAAISLGWPAMAEALLAPLRHARPDALLIATGGWEAQLPFKDKIINHDLVLRGMQIIVQAN